MGHNTPRKRSDGKIDYNNIYNTELKFDGSPDPRAKELADGDGNTKSEYDRGEHSVVNPFDTYGDIAKVLPDAAAAGQAKARLRGDNRSDMGKEKSGRY